MIIEIIWMFSFIVSAWFISCLLATGMTPLEQYLLAKKVKPNIEKILKPGWEIKSLNNSVISKTNKVYTVFVDVEHNCGLTGLDKITIDNKGKILEEHFDLVCK